MSVCILGSINRDIVVRVEALPRPGETVAARETLLLAGGKGANQAVAGARIGAPTRLIGAIGSDADGDALSAWLAAQGVDVSLLARVSASTGRAYIALDDAGENQIIVAASANAEVHAEDAVAGIKSDDRVFLAQLETPMAAIAAFFAAAGRQGGLRILNTAPALIEARALFDATDMLVLNQTELARYLGLASEPRTAADAEVARALLTRPGQSAVVTLGAAGVVLVEREAAIRVPGWRVPVVDTTGAGDCFCGALAAMLAEGAPVTRALEIANAAAALCVGKPGAGPAMPDRRAVEAFIRAGTGVPS
jgi:ribokinase